MPNGVDSFILQAANDRGLPMGAVQYLNQPLMDGIETAAFQKQQPYPWLNPQGFICPSRYPELLATLPDISRFRGAFYGTRKHGQKGHDRYVLDYVDGMELPGPWEEFIGELRSDTYRKFVCRPLGVELYRAFGDANLVSPGIDRFQNSL